MNDYCTAASLLYFANQLQLVGFSKSDCLALVGGIEICDRIPLSVKFNKECLINIIHVLSETEYQKFFEIKSLDEIIEREDIHKALLLNSYDMDSLLKNIIHIVNLNFPIISIEVEKDTKYTHVKFITQDKRINHYSLQGFFYMFSVMMEKIFEEAQTRDFVIKIAQSSIPNEDIICTKITDKIRTKTKFNCITIPNNIMKLKNKSYNPFLSSFINKEFNEMYGLVKLNKRILDSVNSIVTHLMDDRKDDLSIDAVASRLNMSRSSLYRYLAENNVTYKEIVDEKRKDKALYYITKTSISHSEISDRLGYANLSAFYRAFKRWYNDKPSNFRVI